MDISTAGMKVIHLGLTKAGQLVALLGIHWVALMVGLMEYRLAEKLVSVKDVCLA